MPDNAPIAVSFNRRENQRTRWLEVEFPEGQPPKPLLEDLEAVGFAPDGLAEAPPLDGIETIHLSKGGSGLFNGWTPEEEQTFVAEAEEVLTKHGFADVPVNDLTYFDLA